MALRLYLMIKNLIQREKWKGLLGRVEELRVIMINKEIQLGLRGFDYSL